MIKIINIQTYDMQLVEILSNPLKRSITPDHNTIIDIGTINDRIRTLYVDVYMLPDN